MRGNCGGAFKQGLPQSQRDEQGIFIAGYRVAPNCGADFSEAKIRQCPISDANRLASVISVYHRHRQGLGQIESSYPRPTCAIIEALDTLHSATEEMIARKREQAMEAQQHG